MTLRRQKPPVIQAVKERPIFFRSEDTAVGLPSSEGEQAVLSFPFSRKE